VAHQGNVTGVMEELMDIGHVASQERTLDGAVHVSDEIQSDGTCKDCRKPSGSSFIRYGLLKHLNHFNLPKFYK
jgi:hypothetical protein